MVIDGVRSCCWLQEGTGGHLENHAGPAFRQRNRLMSTSSGRMGGRAWGVLLVLCGAIFLEGPQRTKALGPSGNGGGRFLTRPGRRWSARLVRLAVGVLRPGHPVG